MLLTPQAYFKALITDTKRWCCGDIGGPRRGKHFVPAAVTSGYADFSFVCRLPKYDILRREYDGYSEPPLRWNTGVRKRRARLAPRRAFYE